MDRLELAAIVESPMGRRCLAVEPLGARVRRWVGARAAIAIGSSSNGHPQWVPEWVGPMAPQVLTESSGPTLQSDCIMLHAACCCSIRYAVCDILLCCSIMHYAALCCSNCGIHSGRYSLCEGLSSPHSGHDGSSPAGDEPFATLNAPLQSTRGPPPPSSFTHATHSIKSGQALVTGVRALCNRWLGGLGRLVDFQAVRLLCTRWSPPLLCIRWSSSPVVHTVASSRHISGSSADWHRTLYPGYS